MTSDDDPATTHELQEGRYRVSIKAAGCVHPVVTVTDVGGTVAYEQAIPTYNAFINDLPEGEYTIAVTSDCDEWEVTLDKF